MTKKDFELFARVIAVALHWRDHRGPGAGFIMLVQGIEQALAGSNPRFDLQRFRAAVAAEKARPS